MNNIMRLLEVVSKIRQTKTGEKKYTKFLINIPNDIIESLEWKKGMELKIKKLPSGILIKKA